MLVVALPLGGCATTPSQPPPAAPVARAVAPVSAPAPAAPVPAAPVVQPAAPVAVPAPPAATVAAPSAPVQIPAPPPAPPVQLVSDEELARLAAQSSWDEVISVAADRLARSPDDQAALYWSGRAHMEQGRALLGGGRFAHDLGITLLHRATELLSGVRAEGPRADAAEWAFFSRYLAGDDEALPADLQRAAAAGSGYAARLRGQLAHDRGEDALPWFERAAAALPDRADVRLDLAGARAAHGDRAGALTALEDARALGADRAAWLATLLAVLPTADDANDLLARLAPLLAGPGAERDAVLAWYRAWALQELGRFAEAETVLAAATENRRPEIDRAQALLRLRLGRPMEAAALVRALAEAGDADALDSLVSAADALGQTFHWDDALALYDEALAIEPAHPRARANRALTEARAGRPLSGYDALVAAYPDRADLLNDSALARLGRGERDTARALLERAAALPDGAPGVADARENLAALRLSDRPPDAAGALALLARVLAAEPARDRALVLRAQALKAAR
jgi:hypothetical protein